MRRWLRATMALGSLTLALAPAWAQPQPVQPGPQIQRPPQQPSQQQQPRLPQATQPPAGFHLDAEVARVKRELRAIQDQPIAQEVKVQRQRALIERETASARAQVQALQVDLASSKAGISKESKESKDAQESSRDRKKAAMDNIQKFLDILRSMNPQI